MRSVVPAHAGVVPPTGRSSSAWGCGPRARGGGPAGKNLLVRGAPWSPRTRGWSLQDRASYDCDRVVPAHAGVVLCATSGTARPLCGPRARGGGPGPPPPQPSAPLWSPRTRGWSRGAGHRRVGVGVVPAHAGVVPGGCGARARLAGGPRARGGGPHSAIPIRTRELWSPRTRGWSPGCPHGWPPAQVVPAHAGVVPRHGCAPPCGPANAGATLRPRVKWQVTPRAGTPPSPSR